MRKLTVLSLLLCSTTAMAQEPADRSFTLDGEFGLIATSGNTETSSLKAKLSASHELTDWSNSYLIEGLYKKDEVELDSGEKESQTTAQKYFLSAQGNYKLENPDNRLFIFGSYEDDRFSGFESQSTIAAGWDSIYLKTESQQLSYSIGPGYSFAETDDGEDVSSFIVRAAAIYDWKISESAAFKQTLSTEIGDENTKSKSESSISAKIGESLSMKFSIVLDHNTDVLEGREKLDTQTAATLVYTFF